MLRPQDIQRLEFKRMANAEDLRSPMLDAKSTLWGFTFDEADEAEAQAMGASTKAGDEYGIWLEPSEVLRHGLTDRMRTALMDTMVQRAPVQRKGISEAREGHSEGLEHAEGAPGPAEGLQAVGGLGLGWRWQRVVTRVDCDECDGTGEITDDSPVEPGYSRLPTVCEVCNGAGLVRQVLWAIDNRPACDWAKAEAANAATPVEFKSIVLPDEIVQAIASIG